VLTGPTLRRLSQEYPASLALADLQRSFTWLQLNERVGMAAGYLRKHGLRRGDRVGLAIPDNADFVVLVLAACQLGLVIVPMDWRSKPRERAVLVTAFSLRVMIVPAKIARRPEQIPWPMDEREEPAIDTVETGADDPCMILLSSGTTGAATGALLSRGALEHRLTVGGDAAFPLTGHRYLSFLPLCFANGISQVLRSLVAGNTVTIHPPLFTARELVAAVEAFEATYIGIVPTALRALLQLDDAQLAGLRSLRAIRVAGSALTVAEKRECVNRIGARLYHGYGTSAFGPLCHWSSEHLETRPDTVGKPYEWVQLRIVDAHGQTLARGNTGLLQCRGPSLADALLPIDGEVTWLRDRWYAPGDIVRLDADGYLYIVGRATDVIIRGGVNVYPELIEQALLLHPAVIDAAVVGYPAAGLGEEVAAFVVLGAPALPEDLLAHCRVHLSARYRPAEIRIVADLPRTTSGKLKRSEVRRAMGFSADAVRTGQQTAPARDSPGKLIS
jgi:long-chain acyl-CoA synthetase